MYIVTSKSAFSSWMKFYYTMRCVYKSCTGSVDVEFKHFFREGFFSTSDEKSGVGNILVLHWRRPLHSAYKTAQKIWTLQSMGNKKWSLLLKVVIFTMRGAWFLFLGPLCLNFSISYIWIKSLLFIIFLQNWKQKFRKLQPWDMCVNLVHYFKYNRNTKYSCL